MGAKAQRVRYKLRIDDEPETIDYVSMRINYGEYFEKSKIRSIGPIRRSVPESYDFTEPNGDVTGIAIDYLEWIEFTGDSPTKETVAKEKKMTEWKDYLESINPEEALIIRLTEALQGWVQDEKNGYTLSQNQVTEIEDLIKEGQQYIDKHSLDAMGGDYD